MCAKHQAHGLEGISAFLSGILRSRCHHTKFMGPCPTSGRGQANFGHSGSHTLTPLHFECFGWEEVGVGISLNAPRRAEVSNG